MDETNCDDDGFIPRWEWEKLKLTEAESEVCNLGHTHVTKEPTYRVPDQPELIRYFRESRYDGMGVYLGSIYHRIHDGVTFNDDGEQLE